jgi:hypothetical protein
VSRSVDLFIDAGLSLDELAEALGSQIGSPLVAEGGNGWVFAEGPVRAILGEHPYVDDGELLFSRYRFVLSARIANEGRPQDSPEAASLRRVAQKIQQGSGWPVLVVHDLQYRDRGSADDRPGESSDPLSGSGS